MKIKSAPIIAAVIVGAIYVFIAMALLPGIITATNVTTLGLTGANATLVGLVITLFIVDVLVVLLSMAGLM